MSKLNELLEELTEANGDRMLSIYLRQSGWNQAHSKKIVGELLGGEGAAWAKRANKPDYLYWVKVDVNDHVSAAIRYVMQPVKNWAQQSGYKYTAAHGTNHVHVATIWRDATRSAPTWYAGDFFYKEQSLGRKRVYACCYLPKKHKGVEQLEL